MAASPNHPLDTALDIGTYRKIRLRTNRQGYYEVQWTERAGRVYVPKRESCRTKISAEAGAYLLGFCANLRAAQAAAQIAQAPTIEALCARWLDFMAPQGASVVRTGKNVLAPVRRLLGHLPPAQVDMQTLRDYAKQRDVKPGTIRRDLGGLRTVLRWALKEKLISQDSMPNIDKDVLPPEGPPRDKFLSEAQEQALWSQAMTWPDQRVKLFVALGLETAARREAILDLTWDRVDLGLKQVDYRVPGKRVTKKRRTRVPISDRLLPVIVEAKRGQNDLSARVINMADIKKPLAKFVDASGCPWVTAHVLRHTWGSLKAMRGASLYDIAKVMGDKIETIEKYYLHLTPDHLRSVVNL